MFYINAKQKQKDFAEKKGGERREIFSCFWGKEGGGEASKYFGQVFLEIFISMLALVLNPWIIHFLAAKNAEKTRLFLDSWLTRFSMHFSIPYLSSMVHRWFLEGYLKVCWTLSKIYRILSKPIEVYRSLLKPIKVHRSLELSLVH